MSATGPLTSVKERQRPARQKAEIPHGERLQSLCDACQNNAYITLAQAAQSMGVTETGARRILSGQPDFFRRLDMPIGAQPLYEITDRAREWYDLC
ncbi:MAG: hypothetical protein V1735_07315 [Nanoarchaeota archaeon]